MHSRLRSFKSAPLFFPFVLAVFQILDIAVVVFGLWDDEEVCSCQIGVSSSCSLERELGPTSPFFFFWAEKEVQIPTFLDPNCRALFSLKFGT